MKTDQIVLSPEIFMNKNSSTFHEDGLFSERIFGPLKNYRCKCGKLNSEVLESGKRCPKCNVLCCDSILRFETFGYIQLPFLCYKPTKLKELRKIVLNLKDYKNTLLNPIRTDINITTSKYLGVHKDDESIRIFENRDNNSYIYLPLRITGIYSLLLGLKYIAEVFKFQKVMNLFTKQYIMSYIKVIPPGMRPISYDGSASSKKIQLSDINKLYISILNLNKVNEVLKENLILDEDDWFSRMNIYFDGDFENKDEEIVEHAIMEYDQITSRYQYYINLIYENLMATISGKEGFIRHNLLGKTIEFSARSVICCDPSLEVYQIGVSKKILYKLWMLYFIHYLVYIEKLNTVWCYTNIINKDYSDNKELFNKFLKWFCK